MDQAELINKLQEIYTQLIVDFLVFLPRLLGALGVLVLGYIFAHMLRMLIRRLVENMDRLLPAAWSQRALPNLTDRTSFADLASRVVFWFIIFLSLTVATEMLDLKVVSTWLSGLTTYLPQLLAAVLVAFVGIAAGKIVQELISRLTQSVGVAEPQALGRIAQGVILLATAIIVAGQIGIRIAFLTQLTMIALASVLGGVALAFGLGSRTLVSNLIAVHYLRKQFQIGQTVRIAGVEGRIAEITSTAVIMESESGRILVPARNFEEETSILVTREP